MTVYRYVNKLCTFQFTYFIKKSIINGRGRGLLTGEKACKATLLHDVLEIKLLTAYDAVPLYQGCL